MRDDHSWILENKYMFFSQDSVTQLKNYVSFEEVRGFSSEEHHFYGFNWLQS